MKLTIGPHVLTVVDGFEPLVVALGAKVDEAPTIAMMPTAKGAMVRRNIVVGLEPAGADFGGWADAQKRQIVSEKGVTVISEEALTVPCGKGRLMEVTAPTRAGTRIRSLQAWIDTGKAWINVRCSFLDDKKVLAEAGPQLRALISSLNLEA